MNRLPPFARVKGHAATLAPGALIISLGLLFSPLHPRAQTKKQPDKYALSFQEKQLAEMVCLPQKYGPNGELLWTACVDDNLRCLLAAKKLRYLDGSWLLTGELKASPWSKPGRFIRTERNAWQENDSSLVSRWTEHQPAGAASGITTLEYDGRSKGYIFHETSPGGGKQTGTGTLDAATGTWTWLGHTRLANGEEVMSRWTVRPISDSAYAFQLAIASESGKWATILEGTGKKSR